MFILNNKINMLLSGNYSHTNYHNVSTTSRNYRASKSIELVVYLFEMERGIVSYVLFLYTG